MRNTAPIIARTAVLLFAGFLPVASVTASEPLVFQPAYAPGPADNPLKGFVPYAGQGRAFPHSLEFAYLPLASLMTGPATATQSATLDLATFASGEITLLLCIPHPLKGGKPLRFANVGQDRDRAGWLTLGRTLIP